MINATKKKKYTFVIKFIDIEKVDRKYGIEIQSNLQINKSVKNFTKIDKLVLDSNKSYYSYLDESKKKNRCAVTMFNYVGKKLPMKTNICCYWCRNRFSSIPIGCPIKYATDEVIKTYYSEITKDNYVIRQNIQDKDNLDNLDQKQEFEYISRNYFLTDGIFCSFNCCLSFIQDNQMNPTYVNSRFLLYQLLNKTFIQSDLKIDPAPHWRLLKDYGGHLSIEEFRESFYKIKYNDLNQYISLFPNNISIGYLYEQKIMM